MAKSYTRVKRGMLFWFDPAETYQSQTKFKGYNGRLYDSHIQSGRRPYMVVSSDTCNTFSPVCCIAPVTTEKKPKLETHVSYVYEGRQQVVLLEQVRTVDIMALGDYICSVSDDILVDIEEALKKQFAIRPTVVYSDVGVDVTLKYLENVVSEIIQHKAEEYKATKHTINPQELEDTAIQLGQMIEDLFAIKDRVSHTNSVEVTSATAPVSTSTPVQPIKRVETVSETRPQKPKHKPRRRAYNRWTPERRKEFLLDYDKMTIQQMSEKYHISESSVSRMWYDCKDDLNVSSSK